MSSKYTQYYCKFCDKENETKDNYKEHMTTKEHKKSYNEKVKYKCNICSYKNNKKFNYESHMKKHNKPLLKKENILKKYHCDMCNKHCDRLDEYKTHLLSKKHKKKRVEQISGADLNKLITKKEHYMEEVSKSKRHKKIKKKEYQSEIDNEKKDILKEEWTQILHKLKKDNLALKKYSEALQIIDKAHPDIIKDIEDMEEIEDIKEVIEEKPKEIDEIEQLKRLLSMANKKNKILSNENAKLKQQTSYGNNQYRSEMKRLNNTILSQMKYKKSKYSCDECTNKECCDTMIEYLKMNSKLRKKNEKIIKKNNDLIERNNELKIKNRNLKITNTRLKSKNNTFKKDDKVTKKWEKKKQQEIKEEESNKRVLKGWLNKIKIKETEEDIKKKEKVKQIRDSRRQKKYFRENYGFIDE